MESSIDDVAIGSSSSWPEGLLTSCVSLHSQAESFSWPSEVAALNGESVTSLTKTESRKN